MYPANANAGRDGFRKAAAQDGVGAKRAHRKGTPFAEGGVAENIIFNDNHIILIGLTGDIGFLLVGNRFTERIVDVADGEKGLYRFTTKQRSKLFDVDIAFWPGLYFDDAQVEIMQHLQQHEVAG